MVAAHQEASKAIESAMHESQEPAVSAKRKPRPAKEAK